MADWANALASGIGAAASTGASMLADQMKNDMAIQAEQRAADIRLDTQTRLMAIQEAMKNRAAERFSQVVKDKAGEEVPVTADPVSKTGLTRDSATQYDPDTGTPGANFQQSADSVKNMIASAQGTLANPDATDAQKEDARGLIAALGGQIENQAKVNAAAVDGKTRKRTMDEAKDAAKDDTLMNDAPAFMAGTGMLASENKSDLEEKKLASREKIAKEESERKERTATAATDQKERAAEQRFEAMMERITNGSKAGNKSAMVQNLEFMRDTLGFSNDQLTSYVTESKHQSPEDIAANIMSKDKFHELTPEKAMEMAMEIANARSKYKGTPAATVNDATSPAAPRELVWDPQAGKLVPKGK